MIQQEIVETAVSLINEVEVLRRAIVVTDGRVRGMYRLVEEFKLANRKLYTYLARYGNIGTVTDEIVELMNERGLVSGGNLTKEEQVKFDKRMTMTHPIFKQQPIPERKKYFQRHYRDKDTY